MARLLFNITEQVGFMSVIMQTIGFTGPYYAYISGTDMQAWMYTHQGTRRGQEETQSVEEHIHKPHVCCQAKAVTWATAMLSTCPTPCTHMHTLLPLPTHSYFS